MYIYIYIYTYAVTVHHLTLFRGSPCPPPCDCVPRPRLS